MTADNDLLGYIPDDDIETEEEIPTKTYAIDFVNGRIGKHIDEVEAMQQAIVKAIFTPRFKCLIYDDDYGSELQDEITDAPSPEYVVAVIPELIRDTLLPDDRIIDVSDFKIDVEAENIYVNFVAKTIYGDIEIKEVA